MEELEAGRVIGSYRVVRMIGKGGMGTVYEVEHVELGVRYALKTFTFDPNDAHADALKTKFLEEGKVLARLKHPNIAHVFDLAFDEQSQLPYFVMDLVTYEDGESYTAEDVEPADIDEDLVLQWFTEVAAALDYIHGEGIVHRDVKPGNLLLGKDNHVVLTDFGISRVFGKKMQEGVHAEKTIMTTTGRGKVVLGTEKYMAPEVAKGEEATPAADAYALGVMLLRWLTGFYYSDNPGCIALLAHKQYKWLPVIAQLIAPASRRPDNLSVMVKKVKVEGQGQERKDKPKEKKRKKNGEWGRALLIAFFVLAGLCGAAWFGYQVWLHYEAEKKANAARIAEIQRQVEEEKKARAEAEAERKVEEKRIADEKEAKRKAEEERRKKREAECIVVETPVDEKVKVKGEDEQKNVSPQKKEEMIIIKDEVEEEEKDYGPIPNVKYKWLAGEKPLRVDFLLSNGAKIEMLPMKKGVFYMSNNWDDKKARHKVTITRPFWISKFAITISQWREFSSAEFSDWLEVEARLPQDHPIQCALSYRRVSAFLRYLTNRYKPQLPDGYVFRLPSDAEFEMAYAPEVTRQLYGNMTDEMTYAGSSRTRDEFEKFGKKYDLLKMGDWQWAKLRECCIGGITAPHASGVSDLTHAWVLDCVPRSCRGIKEITYADEETDPLRYDVSEKAINMSRCWNNLGLRDNGEILAHLVLGPDLIKEKAWENPRKNVECVKPVPNRHYAWERPDKVLKIIKKPKELTFKMAEGGDMIFCTVPAVKEFNMSNPDGQDKLYHKVTLTKPFWITKYCVTTKQWREYAKYDCEGFVREVEKYFPKNPIYMPFTRPQWDGFCEYLNKRYGHQLPKGYVFRLPTEAEWEWAFVGDKDGDVRAMQKGKYRYWSDDIKLKFAKLLKKNRVPKSLPFDAKGLLGEGASCVYVGGQIPCTETFGVCDMCCLNQTFDTYDVDNLEQANGLFENYNGVALGAIRCGYADHETDPVRYAGKLASFLLRRDFEVRSLRGLSGSLFAHIVVGPDIETALKKKELEPYPAEDFGGKLLSDVITHGGLSSKFDDKHNTPEQFTRMLSSENTIVAVMDEQKELRGFHTQSEESPWIQLNLDKRRTITGLQIDALNRFAYAWARHLRVWTSEDGKTWREVAAENQRKHRYRFDLQRKNVKAKYIRIGREPGFAKDFFSLDKILIYGK